uniref:Conserved secreted protein n=1 Tax=Panagrellus redivivus TaxID=6233 RepID=A0A7E5A129_PANRE
MAIIQRAMNPRILIAALVLPLITAELTGFNNAERRVLGMHVTNVPPEIDRSPMTIYFVDIRFKSPLGVTAPHKWTTFNRMLMPYKLVIDNDTISIEVDNDEQACFNAGYYMLVSGHFRSYKPGPFINHIKSYAPKCIDLEGFYMYNGLYRSNNYANLVKDLLPMLMYGEEPAISLIESEMMRCFFHSVSAYDAKPPIDVLTDDDLYTEMAFSQERCLRYKELYTSYETDNHINVTIFGVTSHSCPMGFMIPEEAEYKYFSMIIHAATLKSVKNMYVDGKKFLSKLTLTWIPQMPYSGFSMSGYFGRNIFERNFALGMTT